MVGPPSDERNCTVCNEASDAAIMFGKAKALRRHHLVSLSFSIKVCLALAGSMAVLFGCCAHLDNKSTASSIALSVSRSRTMTGPHSDSSAQIAALSP